MVYNFDYKVLYKGEEKGGGGEGNREEEGEGGRMGGSPGVISLAVKCRYGPGPPRSR